MNEKSSPILEIKELSFSYNSEKNILNNVSLDIYEGEKVAVLGSNGAGKSTFFLNINGVLRPKNGQIIYKGERIQRKNINELRKNVGIVFQDADTQIIASTVLKEISFGPMNLKLSEDEVRKRVNEAIEYMNLCELKDRPPHYLSGGEKKRVSIADIIAMKSNVIIFDEPTASLDPVNAELLEEVLRRLSSDNKTLIISTHDVDFAYRWADRVVVFSKGRIIGDDSPKNIFSNEGILEEADLKKPTLFEVYEILVERNVIDDRNLYPKDIKEFKRIFV